MPGTKKRVPKPGSWKVLMKQCDDIARARAHARGNECENCGVPRGKARLEWAHGFGRAYHAVRHVDDNGRLLCYKCHTWFTRRHYEEWREWLIARMGLARFEELRARRNDLCDIPALERTLAVLQAGAQSV
jgi:hypothetical protein